MPPECEEPVRETLLVLSDLVLASRVKQEAEAVGYACRMAMGEDGLLTLARTLGPAGILIDLSREGVDCASLVRQLMDDTETGTIPIIAFCGHVQAERLREARTWGCAVVTTNGELTRDFPGVMARATVGSH